MTQNRDLRASVGFKTDQASVTKAAASYATVEDAVKGLSASVLALNPQLAAIAAQEQAVAASTQKLAQTQTLAASNASRLTSSLSAQRVPVQDLTALYKGLEDQARRAGAAQDVAASSGNVLRSVSGNPIESGFGTIRSLAGAAGLVAGNSQAGSTIAAFAGLAAVLGPVGIGIAAIGVGLRVISDNADQATKALQASADAYTEVREAALKATRADFQQQLEDARALEQVRRQAFTEAAADLVNYVKANPEFTFPVTGIVAESLAGLGGQLAFIQGNAEKAKLELAATTSTIAALEEALGENATAANDAAEALRKLTEEQLAFAQNAVEIDGMTREQREKEIQQNLRQIEILTGLATRSDTTYDAMIALGDQIFVLRNRTEDLQGVLTSTADLLAREKQFRDNAAKALQDLNQQYQLEAQALERAAEIRQRITDLEIDTAEKLQSARADAAQRERDAIADAEERRREIVAEGAERRQEIETDDAERRAEIIKRFNTDYNNAVGERDALAAYKAKQTRDEELDKQSKAYRKQLDALEKQMDKQLAAVNKGLDKQLRSIQDNLARQERAIADAYQKQLRGLQQSLAEQNALAENARQQQLVLQRNYNALVAQAELMHRAAQFKTIYDYGEMTGVYLDNLWRKIADGARNLYQNGGYVVGGPDGGVYPGSATSGNSLGSSFSSLRDAAPVSGMRGGIYRAPTNVSNNRSVNITFAPNIRSTMTEKQVRRITDDWFTDLRKVGRRI